ncbi:MAG: hypothetical protein FWH06_07650 [Oscillospiraceae bacterium]|nr:hypothetical protein [Oscillospiraceae bacterium]
MSDKKVLTMLERMGMVRKIDADTQTESGEQESESLSASAVAAPAVTAVPDDFWNDTIDDGAPAPAAEPQPVAFTPAAETGFHTVYEPEPAAQAAYGDAEPYAQSAGYQRRDDRDAGYAAQAAPPQTYTDRFMEIEDLYAAFSMKNAGTDTIYLIEEYMKTLPDSLPAESRRTIIMKIIGASGFDFDRLLGDGIDRVNKLNEYASQFAQRTDDYVARCNGEIDALEQQAQQIRAQIEKRKSLHKQQFFSIESEAQRLKEILDFITK